MTLLEMLMVLGILSSIVVGVAKLADTYSNDTRAAVAAQHMSAVGRAAQVYIKDNYTAVAGNATNTTPALITVPMLTAAGYLPSGFSTTNNYNQSVCVLVLEPTANNLNALVVAEGGTTIDDLTLGGVAAAIGASGGGVYSTATTTLRGAMGGWSMATGAFANANASSKKCNGTAGTPAIAAGHPVQAIWFEGGDVSTGLLHRDAVPGHPELNTMNTPLIMGSVQTSGAACTTTGAIARDSVGGMLSCKSGTWTAAGGSAYWKDPVTTFASLPASGDSIGAVRMTTDTGRAFVWTGSSWKALAVDQNGDLTVSGDIAVSGNITVNGTAAANVVQINGGQTEGNACTTSGLVGRDASGLVLSCINSKWTRQAVAKASTTPDTACSVPMAIGEWNGAPTICKNGKWKASGGGSAKLAGTWNADHSAGEMIKGVWIPTIYTPISLDQGFCYLSYTRYYDGSLTSGYIAKLYVDNGVWKFFVRNADATAHCIYW